MQSQVSQGAHLVLSAPRTSLRPGSQSSSGRRPPACGQHQPRLPSCHTRGKFQDLASGSIFQIIWQKPHYIIRLRGPFCRMEFSRHPWGMLPEDLDSEEKDKWRAEGRTVALCGLWSRRRGFYAPGGPILPECLLPGGHLLISLDSQGPYCGDVARILLLLVIEVTRTLSPRRA